MWPSTTISLYNDKMRHEHIEPTINFAEFKVSEMFGLQILLENPVWASISDRFIILEMKFITFLKMIKRNVIFAIDNS